MSPSRKIANLEITKREYHIDHMKDFAWEKTIKIKSKGEWHYLAVCQNTKANITIETTEAHANTHIYIICISKDQEKNSLHINSKILHSRSSSTITILSLAGNQADINIEGGIYIGPGIEKSEGYLTEKNIILWKNTKVNVVPILDVHSNDIKASHGASIDKLQEEDLFYLRSKWLTREKSSHLMIQGHIDAILSHFSHDGNLNEIASIKKQIVDYIL